MTREQYLQNVKNIMINKNPYGRYHQQNFDTYSSYGEMTPINSDIINDMPNAQIVLSEEVYQFLLAIKEVTNETSQEFPFLLYGKEVGYNQIEFDEFKYSSYMLNHLQNKINSNLNNGLVVCHGHSHPAIGNFHENFSLGDFTTYMEMNESNQVFKNRQVELTGCLVTSTGDINFVFYDNVDKNFYRFTDVVVKDKENNYIRVNCYGLHQNDQFNNGGVFK